jgi:hypothetical protein
MDVLPPGQQQRLLVNHDPHGLTNFAAGHALRPDQARGAAGTKQIDLGLTVTEDMVMSRVMVVNEDDHVAGRAPEAR